jgi:hypothetical protein
VTKKSANRSIMDRQNVVRGSEAREIVRFWGDEYVDEPAAAWLAEDGRDIDSFFKGREGYRVTQVTSALLANTREALGWSQRELARRMADWMPSPAERAVQEGPKPVRAKPGTVLQRIRRFEAGEIRSLKVNDLDVARDLFVEEIVVRDIAKRATVPA